MHTLFESIISCLEFSINSSPTCSYITKNIPNDNRSFMFWFNIFTI